MARYVALGLLSVSLSARAYSVIVDNQGYALTWGSTSVTWYLGTVTTDVTESAATTALNASFQAWNDVGCSAISLKSGGKNNSPATGIAVKWLENNWDFTTGDALAVTTNWQFNGSGVARVEILFNGVDYKWTTSGDDALQDGEADIVETATHEIGHALGLDHSRDLDATMWFTSRPGLDASTLSADDERGACFLYPASPFTSGQVCDACTSNSNCVGGACFDFGAEEGAYCGSVCGAAKPCPAGYSCYNVDGVSTPQCFPDSDHCAPIGGAIPLGEFCYDHETCSSNLCLTTGDSAVCSKSCTPGGSGCPSGFQCLGSGNDGVCYPKGTAALGQPCTSVLDCATGDCAFVDLGNALCVQPCGTGCPSGFSCLSDVCIPKGAGSFGAKCTKDLDCQSLVCSVGACSLTCSSDDDCPGESACNAQGTCTPGPTGGLNAVCGTGGEQCMAAYSCFFEVEGPTGTCQVTCDTRKDQCPAGQLCRRVYQDWIDKVAGVCTSDTSGAFEGQSCAASFCQAGLVCADLGAGLLCHRDCNGLNLLGCPTGYTCVSVAEPGDPKRGACKPPAGADGSDSADGADGATDATDGVDGSDGVDAVDGIDGTDDRTDGATDAATDAADGAAVDESDASPVVDGADGTGSAKSSGRGRGSSCTTTSSAPSGWAVGLVVFGLLVVLARRQWRRSWDA